MSLAPLGIIRQLAAPWGLNLVGAVSAARYNAAVPEPSRIALSPQIRSVVVLGNGGGEFWQCFRRHCAEHAGFMERANPLDDFTRALVEEQITPALAEAGLRCQPAYPFVGEPVPLRFIELARLAGLGGPSLLGILVHPRYGPWIAFRAALLLEPILEEPGEAVGFDPCPSCSAKSCIAACPAASVAAGQNWNVSRCIEYRVEHEPECTPRCHARVACVLAPQARYPEDELRYHQGRALQSMRQYYFNNLRA